MSLQRNYIEFGVQNLCSWRVRCSTFARKCSSLCDLFTVNCCIIEAYATCVARSIWTFFIPCGGNNPCVCAR